MSQPLTAEALTEHLAESRPWIEEVIKRAKVSAAYDLDDKITEIASLLAALPDTVQAKYVRMAAEALDVPAKDLKQRMRSPSADGQGIGMAEVKDGRLCWLGEPLANSDIRITKELLIDDGLNPPTVRLTVEGRTDKNETLEGVDVPADEFASFSWLHRSWGMRPVVYVPPSRMWIMRRAIQEVSLPDMKRERVYTFTGWTSIGGRRAFLTGSGAVSPDGLDPAVRVDLGQNTLQLYSLPTPPEDPVSAVQASLEFLQLAPLSVTLPLWSAMYAAPLTSLYSLDAVLWIYGMTQSRKSTLAMLAQTHFGPGFVKGTKYKAPADWLSTITDLEHAMFVTKDLPLVIDDFAPQSAEGDVRLLNQRAQNVIRSVGNRSARGRARSDLSEQTKRPPRGLVIVTAEKILPAVQSIAGRMIVVSVEKGDVAVSTNGQGPLDRAQQLAGAGGPGLYAQAMSAYVRWLAKHWERISIEARAEYESINQFARTQFPSTQSRLMDYFSVLTLGARLGLRFALKCGALAQIEHDKLALEQVPAVFLDLLHKQKERVNEQSPVRRVCEAMSDLMLMRKAFLLRRTANATPPPSLAPGAEQIGWFDPKPGTIYLLLKTVIRLARDYLRGVGDPLDVTEDSLAKEFKQAGLVQRVGTSSTTRSEWVGGATASVLVVNTDAVYVAYGIQIVPDDDLWKHQYADQEKTS